METELKWKFLGGFQGREGKVVQVYRKKWVIHVERITREKVNGKDLLISAWTPGFRLFGGHHLVGRLLPWLGQSGKGLSWGHGLEKSGIAWDGNGADAKRLDGRALCISGDLVVGVPGHKGPRLVVCLGCDWV